MNLKTTRITTSGGAGAVLNHVLNGQDNEQITIISGSEFDVTTAMEDAQHAGVTYGLRHISIASKEIMTNEQRAKAVEVYCNEHNIRQSDIMLRVRHNKQRHEGAGDPDHEHLLIREYDPTRKRVLNCSNYKRINEKVSRILEVEFGHAIVKGKHNKAALRALEKDGKVEVVEKLLAAKIDVGKPAISSYSSDTHQNTKRNGMSMPELKAAVVAAFKSDRPLEHLPSNILVSRGTKKWIAEAIREDGSKILIGSIDRITKSEDAAINAKLTQKTMEITNVRSNTSHPARREAPLLLRNLPDLREFCRISAQRLSIQNVLRENAPDRQERGEHRSDNQVLRVRSERATRTEQPTRPVAVRVETSVPAKAPAAPRPQASPAATRQPGATGAGKQVQGRQAKAGRPIQTSGHSGAGGGQSSGGGKIVRPFSGQPGDLARFLQESAEATALKAGSSPPVPPPSLQPEIIQAWIAFFFVAQTICDHKTNTQISRDVPPSSARLEIDKAINNLENAKRRYEIDKQKRGIFDIRHSSRTAAAHDFIETMDQELVEAKRLYGPMVRAELEHAKSIEHYNINVSRKYHERLSDLMLVKDEVMAGNQEIIKMLPEHLDAAILKLKTSSGSAGGSPVGLDKRITNGSDHGGFK